MNTEEELVYEGVSGHTMARAYIARFKENRPQMTEDGGERRSYYKFRIELVVGEYVFQNYGEASKMPLYFAHQKNAREEIRQVMTKLGIKQTGP